MKQVFRIILASTWAVAAIAAIPGIASAAGENGKKAAAPVHPGGSGLPIPRFVSLAPEAANMRAGPGVRYPITWVYRRKGTPLMVMAEYEYWRKVRDVDGTEGWMHRTLLRGRRMAVIRDSIVELRQQPKYGAAIVLRAEAGVIARLSACQGAWCELEFEDASGWLPRTGIFGALPNENFP